MTRDEASGFCEHLTEPESGQALPLVEACMRALAARLGHDPEPWGAGRDPPRSRLRGDGQEP